MSTTRAPPQNEEGSNAALITDQTTYYIDQPASAFTDLNSQRSEVSGVAQNLQAFLQTMNGCGFVPSSSNSQGKRRDSKSVSQNQMQQQQQIESHHQINSCPSERQLHKQVRFDIKEGLQKLIRMNQTTEEGSSGHDENDALASNYVTGFNPAPRRSSVQLNCKKRVTDSASRSRSKDRQRNAQSPQSNTNQITRKESALKIEDERDQNCCSEERARNKVLKKKSYKSRQLALKYKRDADDMRRRKFGIEPSYMVVAAATTDTSTVAMTNQSLKKNDSSRETPNFSLALSKRGDELEVDEQETEEIEHKLEIDQVQMPPPSAALDTYFEEINYIESVGSIVKNNVVFKRPVPTFQRQSNNHSTSSSHVSQTRQPGTIIRQRSQSPAVVTNFGALNKLGGSIVKNQSHKILPQITNMLVPSLNLKEQQQRLISSPRRDYLSSRTTTQQSSQQTTCRKESYAPLGHQFGTIWDLFFSTTDTLGARLRLIQITEQAVHIKTHLLSVLLVANTNESFASHKVLQIRRHLPKLVIAQLSDEIMSLINLRERRDQRSRDLKATLRGLAASGSSASSQSQHERIKSELLRDIVARLNQKMALQILRLQAKLKKEMRETFEMYYQEYVASTILKGSLGILKDYKNLRQQRRDYLESVKEELKRIKQAKIMVCWRNLKSLREAQALRGDRACQVIAYHRLSSLVSDWRSLVFSQRIKQINQDVLQEWFIYKYRKQLFLRWVYSLRQTSKIKRKALIQVTYGTKQASSSQSLADEQWFRGGLTKAQERFHYSIAHQMEERRANFEALVRHRYLRIQKKVVQEPPVVLVIPPEEEQDQVLDINLKYQIHSALVMQQNRRSSSCNAQARSAIPEGGLSFISDGERQIEHARVPHYVGRIIKRNVPTDDTTRRRNSVQPVLRRHTMFQMHQESQGRALRPKRKIQYDQESGYGLLEYLRLKSQILFQNTTDDGPRLTHYLRSLCVTATDVINKEDFKSLSDYIQYGIAAQNSRHVFSQLFQKRSISTLFSKWRERFQVREYHKALGDIHTANLGRQVLTEWHRAVQQRKLRVKEFQRVKHLERFYQLFKKWAACTRQQVYIDRKEAQLFRKRQGFNGWIRYLDRQGNQLIKIIQAQNYYKQSLLSKGMLCLYQNYLQQLRAMRFRRFHCFRKYFKGAWMKGFTRLSTLRKVLSKLDTKSQLKDRMKYQREYEVKRQLFLDWRKRSEDKARAVSYLVADNHHRQSVVIKTFFVMRKLSMNARGARKLGSLMNKLALSPAFERVKGVANQLQSSETNFKRYRTCFALTRSFIAWKEQTIQKKLARLFFLKRVLRHWREYMIVKRRILPLRYRERRLKAVFLSTLTRDLQLKWNEKRSDIIMRQLWRKRRDRLLKISFLRLLENVLASKKRRIVAATVIDFRNQNLASKCIRVLKRRWLKQKKRRLMNQVAKDFSSQIKSRKTEQLKESLLSSTNDYEMLRLRDLQVFDDPVKLAKYRVLAAWKMYISERLRKDTVLDRFLLFKARMTTLRCFLGWRSVAKYEQSSSNNTTGKQLSRVVSTSEGVQMSTDRRRLEERQSKTSRDRADGRKQSEGKLLNSVRFAYNQEAWPGGGRGPSLMSSLDALSQGASATFGMRSLASNQESLKRGPPTGDTPRIDLISSNPPLLLSSKAEGFGQSSLFDELESIFQKNRRWLDEQREREEFLKEMASHYNQRLSNEMTSLRYSGSEYQPNTLSIVSRK